MKRLSIGLAIAILALAFTGIGLPNPSTKTASTATLIASPAGPLKMGQTMFYWYYYPDDYYDNYRSISDECYELWVYYGVLVNSNPMGGTMVARGYINNVYPHNYLPSQLLYAHY